MRLHQTEKQPQKRCFSPAGRADKSGKFARGNSQVYFGKNLAAVFIAKAYIPELNFRRFAKIRYFPRGKAFVLFLPRKISTEIILPAETVAEITVGTELIKDDMLDERYDES